MSSFNSKNCGCKGIRTCLLCEKQTVTSNQHKNEQPQYTYTYCPSCDLCWPNNKDSDVRLDYPLYLGRLRLLPDFISEEEEVSAISAIDKIQWMPSQSGRRKQDFGPKVNFKKKKVKVGEFKGFPKFTENILKKLKNVTDLSDFRAVELCHLEYSPERGSSIDPHVDDFWLWGERLVTINLESSTVLTLIPFAESTCQCIQESHRYFSELYACTSKNIRAPGCSHKFDNKIPFKKSLISSPSHCHIIRDESTEIKESIDSNFNGVVKNDELLTNNDERKMLESLSACIINCDNSDRSENQYCGSTEGIHKFSPKTHSSSENFQPKLNGFNSDINSHPSHQISHDISSESSLKSPAVVNDTVVCEGSGESINDMCSEFRSTTSQYKVAVQVVLPPRSLLVLSGCARYNWFHEIKRQHVVSRRLAMTFRELTPEFLKGGKGEKVGEELLTIAKNFCDFN